MAPVVIEGQAIQSRAVLQEPLARPPGHRYDPWATRASPVGGNKGQRRNYSRESELEDWAEEIRSKRRKLVAR